MDHGAHFYRCDFQVHTPRDPQWIGAVPQDDDERRQYAERFVRACREKGLNAVAITDHHDVTYVQYVREAAANELDDGGAPVAEPDRLVVFPGMELTLGVPCQALLILDADYPDSLLTSLYSILAISETDPAQPQCGQTEPLGDITLLSKLYEHLDRNDHLKGRYIVLPNVTDSGHKTLLRRQHQSQYKDMPCVGGFVDGSVESLGHGNRDITDGKNRDYGFKKIGVFQTSDSRRDDFADLGVHSTWVKWAVPRAEALRQACLARTTRISHTEPELPALAICGIEVSNSKFMGPINLEMNPQFNCLIGGRGTGKSTVLEYLRWALCDQPPRFTEEDDLPDFQSKRAGLIENTLIPLGAVVTISLEINGVPHAVRRNARTGQLLLKIDQGEFEEREESQIRSLLPIQAYSQKQLSAVGVRTDELVRFIRSPVKQHLDDFRTRETALQSQIRKSYGLLKSKRDLQRQIEREELELDSLTKQHKKLRGQLKGLSEADQALLSVHDAYQGESEAVESYNRDVRRLREIAENTAQEMDALPTEVTVPDESPNKQTLTKIAAEFAEVLRQARELAGSLQALVAEGGAGLQKYKEQLAAWETAFNKHEKEYEEAKQRASSHERLLRQISDVEKRSKSVREAIAEKKAELSKQGNPEQDYTAARNQWVALYRERADVLEQKCQELTDLSSGRIRSRLRRGAGLGEARQRLEGLVSGTRIQAKRIEELCEHVSRHDDPVAEWGRVLGEIEQLATLEATDDSEVELPETPLLSLAGFTRTNLDRLARKLPLEEWLELSLVELNDIPVFEYRQREGEYIAFAAASAGQQATALLRVLLNQEGPPLIIDQPEEDLDNQVVLEIVEGIWQAKKRRQIVFSSHNANIVVNGDADLVVCCDYRRAGDQSGGRIKCEGAIDVEDIKQEITRVMEGGKEAFALRRDKYGF